jgi:hypothetical protein
VALGKRRSAFSAQNYERSGAADIPERYMLGGRKGAVQYG